MTRIEDPPDVEHTPQPPAAGHHVARRPPHPLEVVRVIIHTLGELSITTGVLLLLFVAWQLWWTDVEANHEQSQVTQALQEEWGVGTAASQEPTVVPVVDPAGEAVPVEDATAFAIIHIPRLGEDYARPVVTGTGTEELKLGLGHYTATVGPGQIGNFSLAGHRTTYGAPLFDIDSMQVGDAIVIETATGYYTYRMTASEIVSPRAVEVVAAVPGDPTAVPTQRMITLTSCHPRYSARQRYIVHGVLEDFRPLSGGLPPALTAG